MIELEAGEGNVLTVETRVLSDEKIESFLKEFRYRFDKWGYIGVTNQNNRLTVTIQDANTAKSSSPQWLYDFNWFSEAVGVEFSLTWVPYVAADTNAFKACVRGRFVEDRKHLGWVSE